MVAVPGTSLDQTMRLGGSVTQALLKIPYVRELAQQSGRAELSDDYHGTHMSELDVSLSYRPTVLPLLASRKNYNCILNKYLMPMFSEMPLQSAGCKWLKRWWS